MGNPVAGYLLAVILNLYCKLHRLRFGVFLRASLTYYGIFERLEKRSLFTVNVALVILSGSEVQGIGQQFIARQFKNSH
jgi:hypothetical protein